MTPITGVLIRQYHAEWLTHLPLVIKSLGPYDAHMLEAVKRAIIGWDDDL